MLNSSQVAESSRLNTEPVLSVSISPDEAYNLLKQLQSSSLESAAQNFTNNLRNLVLLDFQNQKAEIEKEMEQVELRLRQCQGNWLSVDRLSGELEVNKLTSAQHIVQRVRETVEPFLASQQQPLPNTPSEYSNTSSEKDALTLRAGNVTLAAEGEMNMEVDREEYSPRPTSSPTTFQQIPLPPAGTNAQS